MELQMIIPVTPYVRALLRLAGFHIEERSDNGLTRIIHKL